MNRLPTTIVLDLPVGPNPDWELDSDNDEPTNSIFESCVISHSLRQSRERWLSSTFPRFSTRAKRAAEHVPPPHTIQTRGKCDLEIGPHIFPDTMFYEVHYLPQQIPSSSTPEGLPYTSSGSWQSKNPYGTHGPPPPHAPVEHQTLGKDNPSAPLSPAVTAITPALINQVNSAASSNPILANLLQLAAAGLATSDQLKTLGLLIQSLASSENIQPAPASLGTLDGLQALPLGATTGQVSSHSTAPVRPFDLVIEFHETSYERWIFPRGPVTCERIVNPLDTSSFDAILKARLPFGRNSTLDAPNTDPPLHDDFEESAQVVSFRVMNTPLSLWDTFTRWGGDQQRMEECQRILAAINPTQRVYLGHRLSQGHLLGQLQAAAASPHNMKSLKSSLTTTSRNRTKRKVVKHKGDPASSEPHIESRILNKKKAQVERSIQPAQIHCVSCKQTDVPLMLGGRFCRPCVEAGHGMPVASHHSSGPPPELVAPPNYTAAPVIDPALLDD